MNRILIIITTMLFQLNAWATEPETEASIEQPAQFYKFINFGIEKSDFLFNSNSENIQSSWSPKIGLGIGYQFQLSENWLLENELSIDYSKANLTQTSFGESSYGQADSLGIWVKTRLKRQNLFANVSPFIELDAGLVNVDYQLNNTIYKAIAGLEFSLENDMKISIGMGISNNDNFNDI